jgi:DNA-binding winged helix-turn-helix (wHTH) protein/tetratricopeptide (TPR) repeat protein
MAVSRLRRALGTLGRHVVTVRGVGYRLEVDDDAEMPGFELGWGRLEPELRRICIRDRVVDLTEQQAALLNTLARTPGRPVPRTELARILWGSADHAARLDLLLHRLRTRLEDDPAQPRYLLSLRRRGIVLLDSRLAGVSRNAPALAPDLVGREGEVAEALARLTSGRRRVVVHGPPGIGKSAVLRAVAAAWSLRVRRSAVLPVDLEGVQDAREAEGRLVAALGMEDLKRDEVVQRALGAHGPLLLSLDGVLPPALAQRVERWLDAVDTLHVVAGAREAVPGWPVVELSGLVPNEARKLLERVAGRPLDAGADRICRRVDGNPMALELLGKGLRTASTDDLFRRLEVPLTPLRRAWKAALEDLSDAEHRSVLALSPFRRAFDLADVGPVVGIEGGDVPALVDQLVGRSVLLRTERGRLTVPSAAREILRGDLHRDPARRELRHRYVARCRVVLERLVDEVETRGGPALDELELRWPDLDGALEVGAAGPSEDPRLLATLARRAAQRTPRLRRERWSEALREASVRVDLDPVDRAACLRGIHALDWAAMGRVGRTRMLREALDLAARGGGRVLAGAIAAELASVVAFSFSAEEARQLLRAFPLPVDAPADERIRRNRHVGRLGIFEGRPQVGIPRLAEAVAEAEEAGLPLLEALCRMWLGHAISVASQSAEAEHHLRRAVALTAEHHLPEQHIRTTLRLSQHLLRLGLRAEAVELLDNGFDAAIKGGLVRLEEQVAGTLGYLRILEGRFAEAIEALDRTVDLCREHGGQRALWVALSNRGLAHGLAGRTVAAEADLTEALAMEAVGGWYRALAVAYLAVARAIGGSPSAVESAEEAIAQTDGLEHPEAPRLAEALRMLRSLAAKDISGDDARAWIKGFAGGAEVKAVVLGIERAARGSS